jgi:hypothetical protein
LPSLNKGWLPQEPMDMKGYRFVFLNPQAPPTVATIQESRKEVSHIAHQIDETQMPGKRRMSQKECEGAHQLTVVVGAGAVGLAVPGGPGWHPSAKVPGGVAGVEVLRVDAGVELSLAAAADGEEGQERERRSGGGEGGAHRCFSISAFLSFYRQALERRKDWAGSSE